jgi:7-carboxy-7-deazaguanine synthase
VTSSLVVTEIYASVQGESQYAGKPCTFVRLTGCPLRCRWCDTAYSFEGGTSKTLDEIIATVKNIGVNLVELTGGEPLAQKQTAELINRLIELDYKVLIETGGSESLKGLHSKAHIIMDIKCPGSKMADRNLWDNLNELKPSDEIKFVLADRNDYEWTRDILKVHNLENRFNVLLSCAFGLLAPKDLVGWMLEDKLNVRLNLQQHKYIWNPRAKGV